jgi:hypothetical protein
MPRRDRHRETAKDEREQRMNRTPVLLLSGLAAAGAVAVAATLASLGGTASAGAAHPAVSRVAAVRRISQRQACQAAPSACPRSWPGNGTPAASPSAAPRRAPSSHGSGTLLADGLYTDAADGTPHYVIALDVSGTGNISGSVTFLYQDGRTQTIGSYTGKLSGGGRLRMIFAGGKALVGTYGTSQLTLTGCTSVLTWAVRPAGCRFTYHGHVP